jgi:peptide/nickel transport system substrate-binding protein
MRPRIIRTIALLCAAGFLVTLAACYSREGAAQPERIVTISHSVRDLPSVFASMAHGGPHWVTTTFLYDTLVWKDQNGIVPLLAENWQSSADKTQWTFKLRSGVVWHDGKTFSAEDVKFTFDYLRQHPHPSTAAEANRLVNKIEITSSDTISFALKSPSPDFLLSVAGAALILPKHVWQSVADPLKFLEAPAFIGTGPFRYVETRRGEFHSFAANDKYFLGKPAIDRLVMKQVSNPPLALESGDIDATGISSPKALARFKDRDEFAIVKGPYSYFLTKLVFNHTRAPFNRREVRQAIAYALDRPAIVRQALEDEGIVSSAGLLHPDSEWFAPDLPKYEHDRKRAEELLDKAGFAQRDADGVRKSADGKRLEFTLYQRMESGNNDMSRQAEMIRDQLRAVGVKLDIKPLNTAPLEGLLAKGDFDISFDSHGGNISLATPATNPDFPAKTYRNEELKKLYAEFTTALDSDKRRAIAVRIQQIIADDLPGFPIANPASTLALRKSKGIAWYWTRQGLGNGAPIWWNKLATLKTDPALAVVAETKPTARSYLAPIR